MRQQRPGLLVLVDVDRAAFAMTQMMNLGAQSPDFLLMACFDTLNFGFQPVDGCTVVSESLAGAPSEDARRH